MIHEGVAEYLGSAVEGLAYSESSDEGNVFIDQIPATPDRAVAVYINAGDEADSKLPYDPVRFQVAVRSEAGGTWALRRAAEIYSLLHAREHFTLPDGTRVVYTLATQASPFRLPPDANGRPTYTITFRGEVHSPTAHRP